MEAFLRIACLLAGLLAVHGQCPPSWTKVETSCYRAFGQALNYNGAAQACRQFVGLDGVSPGHLATPITFEERRAVRKLRFDILTPLRGNQIGEGQRLRPRTVWMGFRLGQGFNSSWDSNERYDNGRMMEHWGPNRPQVQGMRPQGPRFDPTNFRWNGHCMTLPGAMQFNGAIQKWGHLGCNSRLAYICEISAPGVVDGSFNQGGFGFNDTTSMGPGGPGWGQPGFGGGRRPGFGQPGRGGQGGWNQGGQGGWNNQGGQGNFPGRRPGFGQGGAGGAGWNPNQPGGRGQFGNQGPGNRWGAGQGGAGQFPGQGGAGRFPGQGGAGQFPGQGGRGQWGNQQPGQFPNRPRMYQQAAMP